MENHSLLTLFILILDLSSFIFFTNSLFFRLSSFTPASYSSSWQCSACVPAGADTRQHLDYCRYSRNVFILGNKADYSTYHSLPQSASCIPPPDAAEWRGESEEEGGDFGASFPSSSPLSSPHLGTGGRGSCKRFGSFSELWCFKAAKSRTLVFLLIFPFFGYLRWFGSKSMCFIRFFLQCRDTKD